jgi:hypothetical protein
MDKTNSSLIIVEMGAKPVLKNITLKNSTTNISFTVVVPQPLPCARAVQGQTRSSGYAGRYIPLRGGAAGD